MGRDGADAGHHLGERALWGQNERCGSGTARPTRPNRTANPASTPARLFGGSGLTKTSTTGDDQSAGHRQNPAP